MLDMRRPPRVTQSDAIFSVILVSSPFNLTDEESSGTSKDSFLRIWIVVLTVITYYPFFIYIKHCFYGTFKFHQDLRQISLLVNYDSTRFYQKESVNDSFNMNIMIFF